MTCQLRDIGVAWEHVAAFDMETVDKERLAREVAPKNHVRYMGPSSQCCALTNFGIYRRMVAEGLPAALVLQDDVELSADIKPFIESLDWVPDGVHVVQFEKYGKVNSKRLLGPSLGVMPAEGRALHRLHSRTGGAACYLITQEGAARILAEKPLLKMPIDHFLFSPNVSCMYERLGVAVVQPALARQREGGFGSDIEGERRQRRKSISERLRRLWQEVNRLPSQLWMLTQGARYQEFGYAKLASTTSVGDLHGVCETDVRANGG